MNKGVNMSVQLLKTNLRVKTWLTLLGVMLALTLNASAQFSSGSTGADGPLDFSNVTAGSVVIFDPTKFTAVPHVAGQNIFNFTTITIPANVTVVLSGQNLSGPVFWLAQGDVRINGHITLDGQPGSGTTTDVALRIPSIPGPGGYSGGVGGGGLSNSAPTAGNGPGGGRPGDFVVNAQANGGTFTGTATGPLIGGSGGGGGRGSVNDPRFDSGGGAGGGALLIASSTSITVNGVISANGGTGPNGAFTCPGGGAGGEVRLAANAISGTGSVTATGGGSCSSGGSSGAVQFEAFQIAGVTSSPTAAQSAPGALFLPTVPVSIQVASVAGTALPTIPSGSFQTPDVTINSSSAVPVVIQVSGIPPGTVLTLFVFAENGTFQTVQTSPLAGTLQSSTATANITFLPDLSLGYVKATWTQ
jgi:hypothetical protein